jgi:alcohol dehydrogenase class IV
MAFTLVAPAELRFGVGVASKALEACARFGREPFLIAGGRSFESLPVAPALAGLPRVSASGEPDVASVDEAARRAREAGADVILAVGGGSVLDTGKAVAGLVPNGGSIRDYLEQVGDRKMSAPPLPFVAVPTTAGSGSEATKNAVIRVPDLKVKRSFRDDRLMPRLALVDPELSAAAPRDVAASAGLDALTHLIEGFTSSGAHPMTDALAGPGLALAGRGLRALADGRPDADAMSLASLWGGIVLANAGLGAVHGLVAPLGGRCAVAHGTGCAALLVETTRANLAALRARAPSSPALARYVAVAEFTGFGSIDGLLDGLDGLRRRLGVKALSAYGLSEADLPPIVKASRGGSMRTNPVELSDAELEGVLRACL